MTRPDEDDLWRSIVENYGERPRLDDLDSPDQAAEPAERADPPPDPEPAPAPYEAEERFVPPPPPPLPRPTGPRGVAWAGLFGSPLLMLVGLVLGLDLPSVLDLALVVWFVGGFVYLVATMRKSPPDPWDDGSRV